MLTVYVEDPIWHLLDLYSRGSKENKSSVVQEALELFLKVKISEWGKEVESK